MEEKRASLAGIAIEVELTVKQYLDYTAGLRDALSKFEGLQPLNAEKNDASHQAISIFVSFAIC